MTGRVTLVGAGPGAPDLLTLRGARALREADAVVYDALASTELLALVPESAELHDVGKRGHEAPTLPQEEITALLLRLAREGKRVVRLKGGDPYVFGRGGEEGGACVEAGIPLEVVPGVSSIFGALAYAGIPITDRRYGASFAVVTGHKDPSKVTRETRWSELATAADTLLILMGMRNLEEIVARLLEAGRDPSTPAAVVMEGTLPGQRVVTAPLAELVECAQAEGVSSPSVVVVGQVVKLRETLAWFERQPLFGQRVLVTRSVKQAGELVLELRSAGAEPWVVPMIRIAAPDSWRGLDAALDDLAAYDAVLFTSQNAVDYTVLRARERGVDLRAAGLRSICVGERSAEAALRAGLAVHGVPERRFDAEGVLDLLLRGESVRGRRYLLPRSSLARDVLPDGLRAAGATVDAVTVYVNEPAEVDAEALCERLRAGALDALLFTSPSTARRFSELLDEGAKSAAARCVVAAIGGVTADALSAVGLPADVVSERPAAAALVAALSQATRERRPER